MEKRHYITAIFLLLLPIVVIYALTNYGIDEPMINQDIDSKIQTEQGYACQQNKLKNQEGRALRVEESK